MKTNRFRYIIVCISIAQLTYAQNYLWQEFENGYTNIISCSHDHEHNNHNGTLKSGDPEDEFIPEKGDRADDAVGLNILLIEGQASPDREELLFPREREQEFIDGISGYLYDMPLAIPDTKYAQEDMPYIQSMHYLNFSESSEQVPEGIEDGDIMRFANPNEGTGTNPLKEAVRSKLAELENNGITIDIIGSYLPFSGDLTPSAGAAIYRCDRSRKYRNIYINSSYNTNSNQNEAFAGDVKKVTHEIGHTIELNHEFDDDENIVGIDNPCELNHALFDNNLQVTSLMGSINSVKSVMDYKNLFGSPYSDTNSSRAINVFEEVLWVPKRSGVATSDNEIDFELEVFPNPVKQSTQIKIPNGKTIKSILMYNDLGQKVRYISNINKNIVSLDVTKLNNGNYYLNIWINEDMVTKHIIKIE